MDTDDRLDLLEGNEHEDGEIVNLTSDDIYHDGPVKPHIRTIRSANFDEDIKTWVERDISNITDRFHKIDENVISSYFIKACSILGKNYTIDEILGRLGTTKSKKKIIALSQGTYVKRTPANNSSVIVPYMETSPVTFIPEIVHTFAASNSVISTHIHALIKDICHFADNLCTCDNTLMNYIPRSCAGAFVYFYLYNFTRYEGTGKFNITKTAFKKMSFGPDKTITIGNTKDFDNCLKIISDNYKAFLEEVESEDEILKLIKYNHSQDGVFEKDDV